MCNTNWICFAYLSLLFRLKLKWHGPLSCQDLKPEFRILPVKEKKKKKSVSFLRILLIHFHRVHVTWTKNKNYFVGTPAVIIHVSNFFCMYCPSWHQGHLCTKFLSSCIPASLFYYIRMPFFLLRVIPSSALVH